ncbi:High mobility group protein 20A [Fasciola hepatica]|uniref:High mobility group protein 20A n=1 Tax=Fasciola hepatica TaxID=6192 RepID=A0A4E0RBD8_FASHE|nr:High mobility group protein 20A [Fasciola hepatica]
MRGRSVDKNAPRKPLTAFMMFMKERRSNSESLASLPFGERNRILGAEWSQMSKEQKQVYSSRAAEERAKYNVLLAEYKSSESYKTWLASNEGYVKNPKRKKGVQPEAERDSRESNFRVSIFTTEFLQYNRLREVVLRQLKKQAIQLEEETALLSKHVENLVHAETRTKTQLQSCSEQLANDEQIQKRLYRELVAALAEVSLPCSGGTSDSISLGTEHITETSVQSFFTQLEQLKQDQKHPELIIKAQELLETAISKKILKLVSL